MKSKGHMTISFIKSAVRIFCCIDALAFQDWHYVAIGFLVAELLGILEELVDKRGSDTGAQGPMGPPGMAGKSAYDAAVAAGYTGTETAFNSILDFTALADIVK